MMAVAMGISAAPLLHPLLLKECRNGGGRVVLARSRPALPAPVNAEITGAFGAVTTRLIKTGRRPRPALGDQGALPPIALSPASTNRIIQATLSSGSLLHWKASAAWSSA